ncbi:hypothetical protein H4P12_12270 [Paracoccus sp. 11-3]|uniref:Uncharacterized protein n=1 Tax=Paracoccus amoyensis TaxID=2760093 RepID=A0A926GHP7_9RHOB|nr:hypothetical protein [Paracoccus amoyensis]
MAGRSGAFRDAVVDAAAEHRSLPPLWCDLFNIDIHAATRLQSRETLRCAALSGRGSITVVTRAHGGERRSDAIIAFNGWSLRYARPPACLALCRDTDAINHHLSAIRNHRQYHPGPSGV